MKKSTLTLFFTLCIVFCFSQTSEVSYTASTENIRNPERGFYVQRTARSSNGTADYLIASDLQWIQNTFNVSLLLRLYYLDAYTQSDDIDEAFLDMIRDDAATLRQKGMKAILRFAYSEGLEAGEGHGHGNDAPYDRVLKHISQELQPVLQEISDVIAVVQAGFVGSYGEWAFADPSFYIGDPANGVKDETKLKNVVEALLTALPASRMIQVRTPYYKIGMYNTGTGAANALQEADAYGGSSVARIGHHNDCFLGSYNDYFTYIDPDPTLDEYPYLAQDTRFLPMGGETCPPIDDDPNDGKTRESCSNDEGGQPTGGQADTELDMFHWSYLNIAYYQPTITAWDSQQADPPMYDDGTTTSTCLEDIQRRLGYRFELQEASYEPTTLSTTSSLGVNIVLKNTGYASPYNPRDVELVLVNTAYQNDVHIILLPDQDPRYWFKESELSEILINEEVNLPAAVAAGTYNLYLNLPDPEPTLRSNPAYSIQLANTNVWDAVTGYNDLKQIITVVDNTPPTAVCQDITVSVDGNCQSTIAAAQVNNGSSDPDFDDLTLSLNNSGPFGVGSHSVTLTVSDEEFSDNCTATITVEDNEDPAIDPILLPIEPVSLGIPIDVTAEYSENCSVMTAEWNWGDLSTSTGQVSGNQITGSHDYAQAGVYTVSLTLTDASGNSASQTATAYIVIYDPSGGFVTGGGWITSPPGALASDPGATGKANFGFVSKYKKGTTIPIGNTEFKFKAGDFKFKSTAYDWLVVAGEKAKFKGVGTVNNQGDYKFMVTARDGQKQGNQGPDEFRIKIWEEVAGGGENIVYDNKMGTADTDYDAQEIGGGQITIHSPKGGGNNALIALPDNGSLQTDVESQINLQPYPNPFSQETVISFHIPEGGQTQLQIFSLQGQLVHQLKHDWLDTGEYQVRWDGTANGGQAVPSGVYLVRLIIDQEVVIKKLYLQRL